MSENYSDYTISFNYEQRLAEYDIKGSIAHSRMLAKQNIISDSDNVNLLQHPNSHLSYCCNNNCTIIWSIIDYTHLL